MSFADKKGVQLISPFKLHSKQPLDLRQTVDTINDRDELVTINAVFDGLRVFVKSEKKSYIWNGEEWNLISTVQITQSKLTIMLNNGNTEGKNKFTFDGSVATEVNITPESINAADESHSHDTATIKIPGFMPKLDGSNSSKFLKGDGTWDIPADTTYGEMVGATDGKNGAAGLVPGPIAGDNKKVLFGDGSWGEIPKSSGVDTARNINGMMIDLTENRYNYAICTTDSAVALKTVTCAGFELSIGAQLDVKFVNGNTANNPTLKVNESDAKDIFYNGDAVLSTDIQANSTLSLRYDGTNWTVVGCLSMEVDSAPNPHALRFTGAINESYDGSKEVSIAIPDTGKTPNSLIVKLNNGDTEETNKFTFDGSKGKTINITPESINAADKNHSHSIATTGSAGFMPKLDGSNSSKFLKGDGTWGSPPNDNTTYKPMTGATTSAAGAIGLVPAPAAGASNRYLRSDGTWQVPPNTTYSSLKNPYAITFTGAVSATYDGSVAKTINIPSAGSVNVPVGTVLFSTSSSLTFFVDSFGGTWEIVGNLEASIGTSSSITLYMFKKTAL